MVQIIRKITADVVKRGSTRAVYAKQNDLNSRFLNVQIQEDGKDIQVSASSEVILNAERPDKERNMFKGEVQADGTVNIPLTSWMLELEGTLVCDVSIVKEGTAKLTTMKFNIYIEAAVLTDEAIVETTEYSIVVDLLARTSRAAEIAEEAAMHATMLRENCEDATAQALAAANGTMPTIKEHNEGIPMSFWIGTREEYDSLEKKTVNRLYIISNDNERDGVVARLNAIEGSLVAIDKSLEDLNKGLYDEEEARKNQDSDLVSKTNELTKSVDNISHEVYRRGVVLFDDQTSQLTTDGTIEFEATRHELFAITLHFLSYECVIFCGKTLNAQKKSMLNGMNVAVASSGDVFYFLVAIALKDTNVHTITSAKCHSATPDFSEAANATITKIVGIM